MKKWDKRFINLAFYIAEWSKDPSTKVGCVIVDSSKRIVSIGFNGFPKGIEDNYDKLNNRNEKYPRIIHAEPNAILFAQRDLHDCIMYVTFIPCPQCAALIIQSGIGIVNTVEPTDELIDRWNLKTSIEMFCESNTKLNYVLR